ncbi:hypothetical protein [Nocardia sp. XZ_19_231]|uniref:hypothetical protein n=1 Tax=Nocardia sp. XZ_19_231 TaxID=2769252 RepID=UPI00188FFC0D|nr:hypothetical protein [Nocardia sp. XZ_19_231]
MLFPIEIKVNINGQVADALSALGEPNAVLHRQVWFAEVRDGLSDGELRLLDSGVIIRFRSGAGGDELTAKLRPCVQEQLVGRFSDRFEVEAERLKYRIEGDWSGDSQVLAASLVNELPPGTVDFAGVGDNAAAALHPVARQFVDTCVRTSVGLDDLEALGPIASTKWTDLELADLEVDMERWQGGGLDFLELSIQVKPKGGESADELQDRAMRKQEKFSQLVRQRGITIAEDITNKTERVLTALAAANR